MLLATYRLQLTPAFGFAQARDILPYLKDLGVSHAYLSPIAEARPGSTHGYDATDPTRIRAELGGDREFRLLAQTARRLGIGLLIDIVPNHVAADTANPWWADVLAHGRDSTYADFFDIDWDAADGKLVLPVLGRPLDDAIKAGELALETTPSPHIKYFDRRFPLAPDTVASTLEETLARQHYRLEFWRTGASTLNYRRFFDISDLAALRMEEPPAFDAVHALPLRLVAEGLIDGVRVDHVDGLADPTAYLKTLRDRLDRAATAGARPILLVEKILGEDELLPSDWPVDGTTGYEFINWTNSLFVDPSGFAHVESTARAVGAIHASFDDGARECKRHAARTLFTPELNRLESLFHGAFDASLVPADARPGAGDLRESIIEISAALDVYRTYIDRLPPTPGDLERINRAIAACRPQPHPLVAQLLRGAPPFSSTPRAAAAALAAIMRWQQFTGPLAAKGVEDTALYRHIALTSLNEVGGPTPVAPDAPARFHAAMTKRADASPRALSASTTHDTKRSEDTRLRINVLSELPHDWEAALQRWGQWHARFRAAHPEGPAPSPADEILIYQSLLGVWPVADDDLAPIAPRLADYLVKAAREAKLRTSWLDPIEAYERALRDFIDALLFRDDGRAFRDDARPLAHTIARVAAVQSLAAVVIKALAPGVPDFYQGTERWDTSLVDPDNRRPVNYDSLRRSLPAAPASPDALDHLLRTWHNGQIKQFVTRVALHARSLLADASASYTPIEARGSHAQHVLAFSRQAPSGACVVIVPRLVARLMQPTTFPLGEAAWADTHLRLPDSLRAPFTNLFTGDTLSPTADLYLRDVFARFPVAILHARGAS